MEEQYLAGKLHTMRHQVLIRNLFNVVIKELMDRAEKHDMSKLETPEVEAFAEKSPQLKQFEFNSPEYLACKKEIDFAIQHHYANNRHHPEHFKNGIADMNLIDLLEMFIDWKASSANQYNGNLRKSIETNGERFNFPNVLIKIFENTMEVIE